ncbi:MAG: outer membrane lipoprotein-sorting protein [Candidatus Kariarchaeaceae archaeon]|jgi:outer membrane lipoprotein-sorting protein
MKNLTIIGLFLLSYGLFAQPEGGSIVKKVNERNEGEQLTQKVAITMVDKRGKKQERSLIWYRKDYPDQRKSIFFYNSPANVRGTAFLTYDYNTIEKDDDQWLYLPALRKTRRISAANRGDYFLGTDLTYEDVKLASKIGENDYNFTTKEENSESDVNYFVVEGKPKSDKIARELGYGKVVYSIDKELNMPLMIQYWDIAGNELKVIKFSEIRQVQTIWTVHRIDAENYKTNHRTTILFKEADYQTTISDDTFTETNMIRGL